MEGGGGRQIDVAKGSLSSILPASPVDAWGLAAKLSGTKQVDVLACGQG